MDVLDEEFKGISPEESVYALERNGEAKYRDLTLDNGRFSIKEAKSKLFEEDGKDWLDEYDSDDHKEFYILDIVIIDASEGNELYKGTKPLEEPLKIAHKKAYEDSDSTQEAPGFLSFDAIKVKNLIKDESKVEVLVYTDLEKENKWVKILSKSGVQKDADLALESKIVPCT